ncbi:hypothetical protein K402DRAFT_138641 [Aulographum hederae CBS 113979]|uniref:Uncharacterized protein n=1 Tax=Aulographum hederae CBS 113979 TaxID=1176131 RepID=A0A6G1GUT8_9PEZI|nr:hypothetical protein K402DRAFT_138641 [Aulographum hederae CBS 113979]
MFELWVPSLGGVGFWGVQKAGLGGWGSLRRQGRSCFFAFLGRPSMRGLRAGFRERLFAHLLHLFSRSLLPKDLHHGPAGAQKSLSFFISICLSIILSRYRFLQFQPAAVYISAAGLSSVHRTLMHEHHDFFLASQHPIPLNSNHFNLLEHHDFFLASQHS